MDDLLHVTIITRLVVVAAQDTICMLLFQFINSYVTIRLLDTKKCSHTRIRPTAVRLELDNKLRATIDFTRRDRL